MTRLHSFWQAISGPAVRFYVGVAAGLLIILFGVPLCVRWPALMLLVVPVLVAWTSWLLYVYWIWVRKLGR